MAAYRATLLPLVLFLLMAPALATSGTIVFTRLGRSRYAFDIFALPLAPLSPSAASAEELCLTDGASVNYNGNFAPSSSSLLFVSERNGSLNLYLTPVPAAAARRWRRWTTRRRPQRSRREDLFVLAFNSVLAIYSSRGDASSVLFVLAADAILVLLFLCLRKFELLERDGRVRRDVRIRAAVWTLTTLLSAMFASRVAPLMPPAVGAVVWTMAVAMASSSFWAFFLH